MYCTTCTHLCSNWWPNQCPPLPRLRPCPSTTTKQSFLLLLLSLPTWHRLKEIGHKAPPTALQDGHVLWGDLVHVLIQEALHIVHNLVCKVVHCKLVCWGAGLTEEDISSWLSCLLQVGLVQLLNKDLVRPTRELQTWQESKRWRLEKSLVKGCASLTVHTQ